MIIFHRLVSSSIFRYRSGLILTFAVVKIKGLGLLQELSACFLLFPWALRGQSRIGTEVDIGHVSRESKTFRSSSYLVGVAMLATTRFVTAISSL